MCRPTPDANRIGRLDTPRTTGLGAWSGGCSAAAAAYGSIIIVWTDVKKLAVCAIGVFLLGVKDAYAARYAECPDAGQSAFPFWPERVLGGPVDETVHCVCSLRALSNPGAVLTRLRFILRRSGAGSAPFHPRRRGSGCLSHQPPLAARRQVLAGEF
jgi:hypothetical protein